MKPNVAAQKIDLFGLKVRWALLPLVLLTTGESVPFALMAGVIFYFFVTAYFAQGKVRSLDEYRRIGSLFVERVRLVDALLLGGLCLYYSHQGRYGWAAGIPLILLDAYCSRSTSRILVVSGVLCSYYAFAHQIWQNWALATVPLVALGASAFLGIVLARFQLREYELRRRDARLSLLMTTASAIAASDDLPEVIAHTLRASVAELDADAGIVSLVAEENRALLVTEAAYGRDGEFTFPEEMVVGAGVSGYVVEMGQPIALAASGNETIECDGITEDAHAAVSIPLINRGFAGGGKAGNDETVGAMTLVRTHSSDPIEREDLEMLQSVSALLASAVYNSRMEERQSAIFLRTLESLATALEARDDYTRGHSHRVCELSLMIGRKLGLHPDALEELRIGTTLHDIGKIGVPDAILNKPGRLDDDEFNIMRQHPVIGYEICRPLMLSAGVLMIIRNHHEKLDGSGYPDGLKGGELPLPLRVVCVADAFDAMSSRRPYRGVMDMRHVISELSKGAGVQFDPVVVEGLKELLFAGQLDDLYRAFWSKSAGGILDGAPEIGEAQPRPQLRRPDSQSGETRAA